MKRGSQIILSLGIGAICIVGFSAALRSVRSNEPPDEGSVSLERSARERVGQPGSDSKHPARNVEAGEETERLKSDIRSILKSGLDRHEKMDGARAKLERLSKIEGSSASIEWLMDTVGDGTDYAVLVSAIFDGADDPPGTLYSNIQSLPESARGVASAAFFQKILESDHSAELIKAALTAGDPKPGKEGLSLALKLRFVQSPSLSITCGQMREIMKSLEGESKSVFQQAYILGLAEASPKDGWKEMMNLDGRNDDGGIWQVEMRAKISAQLWASLGPAASLDFLIQENGSASGLEKSVVMWGNMNPVDLKQWVSENSNKLDPLQQDGVRSGMAALFLDKLDFPAVQEQMWKITDEKIRSDIERRLWEGQRAAIRSDVAKDPSGTMQAIVSGHSKYTDYWIEEAMATWITKDFDKAQSWYQDNWNKLPANKAQFLAAAFANQATGQGDTATARQWAAYIQDPKTKQRIEAGIAKAEARKNN